MLTDEQPNNYVKLFRKAKKNPLYTKPLTFHYFTYCLLSAWWSDKPTTYSLGGVEVLIHKGEFATTLKRSAEETGLSVQNVRTALRDLKLTNVLTEDLTRGLTNGGRVIKVCNYSLYQVKKITANKPSNKPPNKPSNKLNKKVIKEGNKYNPPIIPPKGGEKVKSISDSSKFETKHRSGIKNKALFRQLVKAHLELSRHDETFNERIDQQYEANRTRAEAQEEIKRERRNEAGS